MDDFSRNFFTGSVAKVEVMNKELNLFFQTELVDSEEEYATVDMLERYSVLHFSIIERLENELKEIHAIEAMGLGDNDVIENEDEKQLYIKLITELEKVKMKLELILTFFIDNLGIDAVREVLDRE